MHSMTCHQRLSPMPLHSKTSNHSATSINLRASSFPFSSMTEMLGLYPLGFSSGRRSSSDETGGVDRPDEVSDASSFSESNVIPFATGFEVRLESDELPFDANFLAEMGMTTSTRGVIFRVVAILDGDGVSEDWTSFDDDALSVERAFGVILPFGVAFGFAGDLTGLAA